MSPPPFVHPSFAGLIGAAEEDITPPVGIYARNWGAAAGDTVTGIHRPLTATVLTLQESAETPPLVLAALDLGWWRSPEDEWRLRGALLEALSLDPARVMICLSHTHSGPSLSLADRDRPGGELIPRYVTQVRECLIRAARRALAARREAVLAWSYGRCSLAQVRDLPDPERPRLVCGFNPDGSPDDTLLVGRVTGEGGETVATLVNYACHPVTLAWENSLASPDYVGALRERVQRETGGAPCLFLQGASGELGPREQYVRDPEIADAHGREVAHAALSVLEGMLPHRTRLEYKGVVESGAPLGVWRRAPDEPPRVLKARCLPVSLPLQDLPSLAEIEARLERTEDRVLAERLRRKRGVRLAVGEGTESAMPLWTWRVGDAVLLGQKNEPYSAFQRALRARFPGRALAVTNLVNGTCGYLPPSDRYDHGVYQVWQSPFARGSLEILTRAAEQAILDLS